MAAADNEETDATQVMPKVEAERPRWAEFCIKGKLPMQWEQNAKSALPDQLELLKDIKKSKSVLPIVDASGSALAKLLGSGVDADFEQSRTVNALSARARKLAGTVEPGYASCCSKSNAPIAEFLGAEGDRPAHPRLRSAAEIPRVDRPSTEAASSGQDMPDVGTEAPERPKDWSGIGNSKWVSLSTAAAGPKHADVLKRRDESS